MIFLPSRGRPHLLERFFAESRPKLSGLVLLDEDDAPNYQHIKLRPGWGRFIQPRAPLVQIFNRAYQEHPYEPWYGMVGDDVVCGPDGWDVQLAMAASPDRVAWGDDGINGASLGTSFFVGGELVRAMGWLQHPSLGHLYADTVWHHIAVGTSRARYHHEIKTTHLRVQDSTYRERAKQGDAETFLRLKNEELPRLIASVRG